MRKLIFLSFAFFLFSKLFAQQVDKSNYSLLWEVTGQDLTAPSYVFGTMHVQDKRAFEFSDSVLIAMENTEAFAMEMHPDTMMNWFMGMMLNGSEKNTLKEDLSPEAYKRLEEEFFKKTGSPLDSVAFEDPMMIEMMLTDFDEPDNTEKQGTVVDLYLFKAAYYAGKSMYGLEDFKDYDNVTRTFFKMFEKQSAPDFEEDEAASLSTYEEMINIYRTGDLAKLEAFTKSYDSDEEFDAAMLDTRNIKMTDGILNLAKKHNSMFAAVGAAHLPGKQGVLQMLRDRGYSVRKVQADFTGVAEKYKIKKKRERNWKSFVTNSGKALVDLPNPPQPMRFPDMEAMGNMEISASFDLLEMNAFMVMTMNLPATSKVDKDKEEDFLKMLVKGMLEAEGVKNPKIKALTNKNKRSGVEVKFKGAEGNYQHRQFFMERGTIYVLMFMRLLNEKGSGDEKTFFDSFEIPPPPPPAPLGKTTLTKEVKVISGAYKIKMPNPPKDKQQVNKVEGPEGEPVELIGKQKISIANNGAVYITQCIMQPMGRTVDNDSLMLQNSINTLMQRFPNGKSPVFFKKDGFPAVRYAFTGEGFNAEALICQRGTRSYYIAATSPSNSQNLAEEFFATFEFLPLEFEEYTLTKPEGLNYQVRVPAMQELTNEENTADFSIDSNSYFLTYDTLSGVNYSVTTTQYSEYAEVGSLDEFYESIIKENTEDYKHELRKDTIENGRRKLYWKYPETKGLGQTFAQTLLAGDTYYELIVYLPENKNYDRAQAFYDSFELLEPMSSDFLYQRKSSKILTNLTADEVEVQDKAIKIMDRYEFSDADLPLIYDILENKKFKRDTVEELLAREFLYHNDEKTLEFLQSYFYKTENRQTQDFLLGGLNALDNEDGRKAFFELTQDWMKEEEVWSDYEERFRLYYDSLDLFAAHLDDFVKLYENPQFSYRISHLIWKLGSQLLNEKMGVTRDFVFSELEKFATKESVFTRPKDAKPFEGYYIFDAFNLYLADAEADERSDAWFGKFNQIQDAYLVLAALRYHATQQIPFNKTMMQTVVDDPYQHYYLYQYAYDGFGDLAVLPKKYLDREVLIKAHAYALLSSEYGELTNYKLLEKRNYKYDGKDLVLHLFIFELADVEGTFFAATSQPADGTLNPYPTLFDYITERWDKKKTEEYYQILKDYWEEKD